MPGDHLVFVFLEKGLPGGPLVYTVDLFHCLFKIIASEWPRH